MRIWEVLGIPPTRDRQIIDDAYEQQIKFLDPDRDREMWQELQDAYRTAMQNAGGSPDYADTRRTDYYAAFDRESPDTRPEMPPAPSPDAELHAGQVMTDIESLFSNVGWRDDLQRWRAQLESQRAYRDGVTEVLRFTVFDFLSRQSSPGVPAVSPDIIRYLDNRLGWSVNRDQLVARFSEDRVNRLLGRSQSSQELTQALEQQTAAAAATTKGLGIAVIGWIVALMILTMLFAEMGA